ncbi:MAG: hypothetical protein AMXMBFR74_11370 [Parvibaculum sp.]
MRSWSGTRRDQTGEGNHVSGVKLRRFSAAGATSVSLAGAAFEALFVSALVSGFRAGFAMRVMRRSSPCARR